MSSGFVVFLDFDDVICLNAPYGGYDAKLALSNEEQALPTNYQIWHQLFDESAKNHLRRLHNSWMPTYVISSSWRGIFEKVEILSILERCGLDFVALHMHEDWSTPKSTVQGRRSSEIGGWLRQHPEATQSWVILDDTHSGKDLLRSTLDLSFIVLCQESIGLQQAEAEKMQQALQKRHEQANLRSR